MRMKAREKGVEREREVYISQRLRKRETESKVCKWEGEEKKVESKVYKREGEKEKSRESKNREKYEKGERENKEKRKER
uniref:Uncharacterized protein n=1 Tax=Octopus bimaculoides TaxID=37653 RepID=A0A0L8HKT6_OCTBM